MGYLVKIISEVPFSNWLKNYTENYKFYQPKAKACVLFVCLFDFNGKLTDLVFDKGQVNFRYCTHIKCSFALQKNQKFHYL